VSLLPGAGESGSQDPKVGFLIVTPDLCRSCHYGVFCELAFQLQQKSPLRTSRGSLAKARSLVFAWARLSVPSVMIRK
jgi:hypothetical protein